MKMQEDIGGNGQHLITRSVWVAGAYDRAPHVVVEDLVIQPGTKLGAARLLSRCHWETPRGVLLARPPSPQDYHHDEGDEHGAEDQGQILEFPHYPLHRATPCRNESKQAC